MDNKLLPLATYHNTRNQDFKSRTRFSKRDIRKYTFTNRVLNSVPTEIKNAPSLNSFKNRLDSIKRFNKFFYEFDE